MPNPKSCDVPPPLHKTGRALGPALATAPILRLSWVPVVSCRAHVCEVSATLSHIPVMTQISGSTSQAQSGVVARTVLLLSSASRWRPGLQQRAHRLGCVKVPVQVPIQQ